MLKHRVFNKVFIFSALTGVGAERSQKTEAVIPKNKRRKRKRGGKRTEKRLDAKTTQKVMPSGMSKWIKVGIAGSVLWVFLLYLVSNQGLGILYYVVFNSQWGALYHASLQLVWIGGGLFGWFLIHFL